MKITVRLLAELKVLSPSMREETEMDVPPGTSISEVIEKLDLPSHMVAIILNNKKMAKRADLVQGGDIIELIPPASGG